MADMDFDDLGGGGGTAQLAVRAQRLVNVAGGVLSIALVAGVGLWGYRIAVRDVSGVPVVRALEGPMRVTPVQPGGEEAAHQGLSVNRVAAEGLAAPVPDQLTLAPRPADLTADDLPGLSTEGPAIPVVVPLTVEGPPAPAAVIALAGAIASDGMEAGTDPATQAIADPVALALAEAMTADAPVLDEARPDPALAGLRPVARPASRPAPVEVEAVVLQASADATDRVPAIEVDPATLAVGTRLVQLGAFDDADTARAEWDKVALRFGELMGGKARVIQSAQSGGRTFFRLRAHGFENEDDARRFCSALLAEGTACIPVAVR